MNQILISQCYSKLLELWNIFEWSISCLNVIILSWDQHIGLLSFLSVYLKTNLIKKKSKTIPVRDRGSPWGCETSRLQHFLDNLLTNGGEVVSLTRLAPFTPKMIPGTHFCWRLSRPQGHSAVGVIRSIEKIQWTHWESNPRPSGL
jgi:hypothetical protein